MELTRREFLFLFAGSILAGALAHATAFAQAAPTESGDVASVRLLGNQFGDNAVNVTGQDAATSILLPNCESLWVFGDTVEGAFESIRGLPLADKLSNTGAIVPRQDVSSGIREFRFITTDDGKRARQLIPYQDGEDPSEVRLWPIHGTCVGDEVFVFYHRISLLPGVDVFDNFKLEGMGIARAKIGQWKFERLKARDGTYDFWKGDQPTYGVFVEQRDGFVHLWGSLMTGMFLARTRPESIADLSSYEYLVEAPTAGDPDRSPRWSKDYAPTASLFDYVPNEMSAAFNKHLGKYVAIHSYLRENKIVMRTAPAITGPWSEAEIVFRPERIKEDDLIYAAKEHPELAGDDGRVMYLTFVNSTTYVPQLVEVTLK
jgi:hypothetical protein